MKCALDRHECFLSDDHSRDLTVEAELALDGDGNFLAFRTFNTSNLGAHAISAVLYGGASYHSSPACQ